METYNGHVRTPADAIILFEACRLGLLPRVQRRLSEKERQAIKSGSVFVWDEREAGMRRWTDGKSWSASRVSGSFLTYREMEGKRGGGHSGSRAGKTPDSNRGSDEDQGEGGEEGPDGYRYKPDGLMKQSFSITTSSGQHLHLISYYARSHPTAAGLNQPSTDPALRHIRPQKGLYPESSVNDQQNLPVVTRGPMTSSPFPMSPHPPLTAYSHSGAAHTQSYAPPAYSWAPAPIHGTSHVPVIPYVANYLPPITSINGQPSIAYSHVPHLSPSQAHLHPYDRPAHVTENTLPLPVQGPPPPASAYPYYGVNNNSPQSQRTLYEQPRRNSPVNPGTPLSQVDGRLPPSKHEAPSNDMNGGYRRIPSPPPLKNIPPVQNGTKSNTNSSATTVPSITSLMNGPPPPPPGMNSSARKVSENAKSIPPSLNGSNGGSPASLRLTTDGPKDIPSEKIGFGEDVRALRQLDRVFTA